MVMVVCSISWLGSRGRYNVVLEQVEALGLVGPKMDIGKNHGLPTNHLSKFPRMGMVKSLKLKQDIQE